MKTGENGGKRKLSKRNDPELSLEYYRQDGYHPDAVREYLLTLLNSNFEEWRIANPDLPLDDFEFSPSKMSNSGALFDLDKLSDVCKDVLVKIPAQELADFMIKWSDEFDKDAHRLFSEDRDYLIKVLDVGRSGAKPRKDLIYAKQIRDFISYFYDERFTREDRIPDNVTKEDAKLILEKYLNTYDHSDDQTAWFDKIRSIGTELGYAAKPKDYKKNPDLYKGHVGDVSTVIRLAVTGRRNSPDVWEIQQILGEQRTRNRVSDYIGSI
jgi:glutamyl-tRNA synthetase